MSTPTAPRIAVVENGPYLVVGDVPREKLAKCAIA